MALTLRERLKKLQPLAFKAVQHPLLPPDARALIAETVLLLADLVAAIEVEQRHVHDLDLSDLGARIEKLEKERTQ